MIAEQYVSYEVAKLLQQKGFTETCNSYYTEDGILHIDGFHYQHSNIMFAPTHQMALAWLRNNNIDVCISVGLVGKECKKFYFWCPCIQKTCYFEYPINKADGSCEEIALTYEDAIEAALKYCLTELL